MASRLQLEVERHKRMETDFRRDLAQKNAQIDEIKNEMKAKTGEYFIRTGGIRKDSVKCNLKFLSYSKHLCSPIWLK